MLGRFYRFVLSTIRAGISQDYTGTAAEMAFYALFAFFPAVIVMTSLFSAFGSSNLMLDILQYFGVVVPDYVHDYIISMANELVTNNNVGFLTFGFLISMVVASNAMFAVIKGINRSYHLTETRPVWYTRGLSILLIFSVAIVIFIGTNALVFGKIILYFIIKYTIIPKQTVALISMFRWPTIFLALFAVIFRNYYLAPNIKGNLKAQFYSAMPGTFFFCFAWIVSSWLFSIYLNHINIYDKFFGALGVFAVFLLWLYYTAIVMLIGGEINYRIYEKIKDRDKMLKTII